MKISNLSDRVQSNDQRMLTELRSMDINIKNKKIEIVKENQSELKSTNKLR